MAKQLINARVEEDLISEIKEIAIRDHDGNVTAAVSSLLTQGVVLRSLSDGLIHKMYSSVSNEERFNNPKELRRLVDGLYL